ncbi:MAG: DPP IV N-terminal domain-containing protein [Elusimicrobiota bacterium]
MLKKQLKNSLPILVILLSIGTAFSQNTEIFIGLEGLSVKPKNIFLASFKPLSAEQDCVETAISMRETARADLLYSRYFEVAEDPLNPLSLEYSKNSLSHFSSMGQHYVFSELSCSSGTFSMKGFIFETSSAQKIFEKTFSFSKNSARKAAHIFSDDIVKTLTGRKGIASSKIAFSNDSTGSKEIYISDYDGENLVRLTSHKTISILPIWSNDGYKLYYTTYKNKNPDIYEIDFKKGAISPFSTYQGLNIPGGFSPDGLNLVLTLSKGKDPSIYIMGTKTKELKKLIEKFSVSSSPTFSPDGKEIAFVSDISGNPQIHIYDFETKKIRKITRMNWADSPDWSSDGRWIVFSGRGTSQEKMNIFMADPAGARILRLTRNEGDNEDPCFSPDSRFILFTSTRRGRREIFVMDADGSAPHPLNENLKGNSYTPSWSKI